jgi:hypothetical protein
MKARPCCKRQESMPTLSGVVGAQSMAGERASVGTVELAFPQPTPVSIASADTHQALLNQGMDIDL